MTVRPGGGLPYCFRVRLRLSKRARIQCEAEELVLSEADGGRIVLRAGGEGGSIHEAEQIALRGGRYATAEDAQRAGEQWLSRLQVALARLRVGADFGLRSPRGGVTEHGLRWFEAMVGQRMLADAPGVLVFECDPPPRFASVSAEAAVGKPVDRFMRFIEAGSDRNVVLGEREKLAFDLFSASFFETSADARFLLLMMAAETLIEQEQRPEEVRAHVARLIDATRESALATDQVESLLTSLEWLKLESIGHAGRRLAGSLGGREYMAEPAPRFFTRCYELRSQLVHGYFPRPEPGEVGTRAASLEGFVGDLIAAALIDVEG